MNKTKKAKTLLGRLFQKIAPRIGAKAVLEPEWKIVGQITFKNGRRRYFKYSSIDLNTLGASEIAKDKDFANFFMKRMGYQTVPGRTFFSDEWCGVIGSKRNIDAAYRYACMMGLPVIVKPNSGSQGIGVFKAYSRKEFYQAMRFVFARDRVCLVERVVSGKDYRIVVLDDKVISAYERIPLYVVGDGARSLKRLFQEKQKRFIAERRDTRIKITDERINQKLARQKLTWASAPPRGTIVYLLENANLSSGGEARDVTKRIHADFASLAIRLSKDMGLRLCSVDLMVEGDISEKPRRYFVLEINAAPGLDHYAQTGKVQEKIVERMYLKVLKAME